MRDNYYYLKAKSAYYQVFYMGIIVGIFIGGLVVTVFLLGSNPL